MKKTDLRITPKRLGLIMVAAFCLHCFWYRLHLKFREPFSFFGGAIFKNMEQAEMAIIGQLLDKDGKLPKEFAPFCDVTERVEYPRHWTKYKYILPSGVELYGEPDDIFKLADGTLAVIDHKTAQPKGDDDPLLPCYEVQVIGYGLIAERGLDLGEVSKGGLFYWGANHETVISDPAKYYHNQKLWMPFTPKPHSIEIDYKRLDAPLKQAVELWEAKTPPDRSEKCPDCKKLDALLGIEAEVQKQLSLSDQKLLACTGHNHWGRQQVMQRIFTDNSARYAALRDLHDEAGDLAFAEDGVMANWNAAYDHGF
jgi:PD-(D/E)XK nuclease superfamily